MLLFHYFNIYPKLVICSSPIDLYILICSLRFYFLPEMPSSTSFNLFLPLSFTTHSMNLKCILFFKESLVLLYWICPSIDPFLTSLKIYPIQFIFYLLGYFHICNPYGKFLVIIILYSFSSLSLHIIILKMICTKSILFFLNERTMTLKLLVCLQFKNLCLLHERMFYGKEKTCMNVYVINNMSLFAFKFPPRCKKPKKNKQHISLRTL